MGIRQLDICNRVMAQAQGIAESDFPIDAFPTKVQSVILGMVRHENFKVEYLATAMLSATASALGNTYNIRVKGHWTTNAALYIIMVGRPGLGKTPPLEAVFRPLRKRDCRALEKFKAEMAAYQNTMKESKGNNDMDRPVLRRTIVSDFTPEALMLAHHNCPRGITILADEIMGMFNSANRYNNGQLIEQLLSAWSNSAIDVTRVSNPIPIHIENPCINMVGTTQTRRVHELLKKGYEDNGLLDRIQEEEKAATGKTAAYFRLPNTEGKQITRSNFKDQYLLIHFWASWDTVSRDSNTVYRRIYKKEQKIRNLRF